MATKRKRSDPTRYTRTVLEDALPKCTSFTQAHKYCSKSCEGEHRTVPVPSKDEIMGAFVGSTQTVPQIARSFGVGKTLFRRWLRSHEITVEDRRRARRGK